MSAIEEHSTRDLFDGTLPRLQESLLGYQLPGPVETVDALKTVTNSALLLFLANFQTQT